MKTKFARICMFAAVLSTLTALPAFADEAIPTEDSVMSQVDNGPMTAADEENPDAAIFPSRAVVCYSRNLAGRIFRGVSFMPRRAAVMSLQNCRRGSMSILMARSCRLIRCSRVLR